MMSKEKSALDSMSQPYTTWLNDLKQRIHAAQQRAMLQVNKELVLLYWQIGQDILAQQQEQGWGAKVIDKLAHDLRTAFPEMKGFSPRNLKYMRAFAQAWQDPTIVQEVLALLPWYHHVTLLDKVDDVNNRYWYARKAIEHNWSRNVMVMQIETRLIERQGKAITNFELSLPKPQSDLAIESLKDPYRFDFLTLTDQAQEREIENALVKHVTEFLLELGAGFAFVGQQVHPEVSNDFLLSCYFTLNST
jgi:predicted nuclease of restriction endonuclease-like (RecB) superfamily